MPPIATDVWRCHSVGLSVTKCFLQNGLSIFGQFACVSVGQIGELSKNG